MEHTKVVVPDGKYVLDENVVLNVESDRNEQHLIMYGLIFKILQVQKKENEWWGITYSLKGLQKTGVLVKYQK
ncbi:MAG: hypothetical protein RLZZ230_894 [Candidatus Parcubacteria bacterium]|jgi:hypothetical protein